MLPQWAAGYSVGKTQRPWQWNLSWAAARLTFLARIGVRTEVRRRSSKSYAFLVEHPAARLPGSGIIPEDAPHLLRHARVCRGKIKAPPAPLGVCRRAGWIPPTLR